MNSGSRLRSHRDRRWIQRLRLATAPPALAICVLVLLGGGYMLARMDSDVAWCFRAYEQAATATDSARVDVTPRTARGRLTCGDLRRDGRLELYRQAMERRRAAAAGEGHAVIEK